MAALSKAAEAAKMETDLYDFRKPRSPEIILAARQGDAAWFREALGRSASLDQPDANGLTALYWAAEMGHLEVVQTICAVQPDPVGAINRATSPGAPGRTPMLAAMGGRAEVLGLFLDYGARPDPSFLHYAPNYVEVLKTLLAHGLSPNATNSNGEPILHAAAFRHKDSVRMLIEAGVDVNTPDRFGETALGAARRWHNDEIVQMLLAAGARD